MHKYAYADTCENAISEINVLNCIYEGLLRGVSAVVGVASSKRV